MQHQHIAWIGIGSNLGDRFANLEFSRRQLEAAAGKLLRASSVFETEPWGEKNQPLYLNQVVQAKTSLSALELHQLCRKIEQAAGRLETRRNAPRTLDLDILFFDDLIINSEELIVPHPRLHLRRFVLDPLLELDPDLIHPVLGKSMKELLAEEIK